ncbi:MAG: endonuclease/exonuclease/phosphatase family protein [Dehalococcoidia bacterium]
MSTVTIATLNLFHQISRWDERSPLLLDQLTALRPDVIGLQEVNLATEQGVSLCRQANDRLAEGPPYRIFHMARPEGNAHVEALAVMSRLPVEAHEGMDYLLHEDVAQRLRLRLEDGAAMDFYNTHLYFPPAATEDRVTQTKRLLAWVDTWRGAAATVVVGDFNAYPEEATVALMKGRFASAYEAAHGREPEKTWPTPVNTFDPSPPGCLDYVFVDSARVLEAGLAFDTPHPNDDSLFPSDHLGVMAKLDVG